MNKEMSKRVLEEIIKNDYGNPPFRILSTTRVSYCELCTEESPVLVGVIHYSYI